VVFRTRTERPQVIENSSATAMLGLEGMAVLAVSQRDRPDRLLDCKVLHPRATNITTEYYRIEPGKLEYRTTHQFSLIANYAIAVAHRG
jgi:hypothetical protein